jgi:hypothetical protein
MVRIASRTEFLRDTRQNSLKSMKLGLYLENPQEWDLDISRQEMYPFGHPISRR